MKKVEKFWQETILSGSMFQREMTLRKELATSPFSASVSLLKYITKLAHPLVLHKHITIK